MSEANSRSRLVSILLVVVLVAGGWVFFQNYRLEGLEAVAVRPQNVALGPTESPGAPPAGWTAAAVADSRDTSPTSAVGFRATAAVPDGPLAEASRGYEPAKIRIAAWPLAGFGREKLAKPRVMDLVARVVRTFDVVAIQDLMAVERDLLPRIVEHINRSGRQYDFLLAAPAAGSGGGAEASSRMAFLFDTQRIVTDRTQFYTVADPDNVFRHDPIVGWFQAMGPRPSSAWTFSLVNVHIDLANAQREVAFLSQVLSAVRADGRHEDDVLMAGLFQADDAYLVPSVGASTVRAVVRATPTDIFGQHQTTKILLTTDATTEFMGGGGAVDFLRIYNLTSAQAEEATPYLPVYGEFSPREGT